IHCLHFLLPECRLFCIELREKVYGAAMDFFQLPKAKNIEIEIADAQVAIKFQKSNSTQIVFADMYLDYGMDLFQIQQQFVEQTHRILDDFGWLVINFHELPELDSFFIQCMHDYFADLFICPTVSNNYILFASKSSVKDLHLGNYQMPLAELENKLNIKLLRLFKKIKRYKSETNEELARS
ncbi:TPA: spermine synthase, partial [Legionella anisa]